MYKLTILSIFDPLAKMEDRETEIDTEFETSSQAELRALLWLEYRPYDLVMLTHVEKNVCKHCGLDIEEKVGFIRHRWIHSGSRSYTCALETLSQAEPS